MSRTLNFSFLVLLVVALVQGCQNTNSANSSGSQLQLAQANPPVPVAPVNPPAPATSPAAAAPTLPGATSAAHSPEWTQAQVNLLTARPVLELTVYRVAGIGPTVLVSAPVPFPREQLLDAHNVSLTRGGTEIPIATKELVKWPGSKSIRSVLIQFNLDLGSADRDTVVLNYGQRQRTTDLALTPVTWELPPAIAVPSKEWMCNTGVIGAMVPAGYSVRTPAGVVDNPDFDAHFAARYKRYDDFGQGDKGVIEKTNYYDNMHSLYQEFLRTGNIEYYKLARRWAVYHRTHQIAGMDSKWPGRRPLDGSTKTRYTYVEGLVDDYLLNGDEASLNVAGIVVDQFYMKLETITTPAAFYKPLHGRGFWTEREPSFALLGIISYYEGTLDPKYLDEAKRIVGKLHQMQTENKALDGQSGFIHSLYDHDPEEGAKEDEWGGSAWMTGLLLEGVIRYHIDSQDPVAADSVLLAVDWLTGSCRPLAPDTWTYMNSKAWADKPVYDLNQIITHAYGYAYKLSGYRNAEYFNIGKAAYDAGIAKAGLSDQKHINQNYRSSPNFMGYLVQPQ